MPSAEVDPGGVAAPLPSPPGGAGLYDHSTGDPVPSSAGWVVGLLALLLVAGVGGGLWALNPAFQSERAGGTANQLGQPAAAAGPEVAPGSAAAEGVRVITQRGCGGCHTIPGVQGANGTVGPNLAGVASRPKIAGGAVDNAGPEDLQKWIMDPPALKPGTAMPKLGLSEEEAAKAAAYLETLK